MWALLALTSAAGFGLVSVVDKRVLSRHLPGVSALILWGALTIAVYVPVALLITGIPADTPPKYLLAAFCSGLSLGVGLALMFLGLRLGEAARAVAIVQIYPVFVALLAAAFLEERLAPLQWVAMALVVLGAMLVSLDAVPSGGSWMPGRGTPVLVASGLFAGLAYFSAKLALGHLSVWTAFAVQQLGVLAVASVFARPRTWRQLGSALRRPATLSLLVVGEGLVPIAASVVAMAATSLGPVSLVTAFLATRPLFVFIFATALSRTPWSISDAPLAPRALVLKVAAIVMIVAGVAGVGLL
jgi:transporter family protein